MFTMSRIVLAVMAILLLLGPLGLADSPACRMSDLAQAASMGDADPCPYGDQRVKHNAINVHNCDCGVLMLPANLLDTAVAPLAPLSFVAALLPQTDTLAPPAPPPRFI
jgi:hypothetical protein